MADEKSIRYRGPQAVAYIGIAAVLAVLALIGGAEAKPGESAGPRKCFPAKLWDARAGLRPCARIVRVAEDGSVRLRVEDASGRVRWRATVGARDR